MSIFIDTFKYRQQPCITPLENFSTEILKHIFIRHRNLLKHFIPKQITDEELSRLEILSQVSFSDGIIDILITDFEGIGVIIENKIDAEFQQKQIVRYREFVNRYKINKVIALMVHSTDCTEIGCPDDVIFWSEFVEKLEFYNKKVNDLIINDFIIFTKEYKMALEKVKWPIIDGPKEKQNFLNMVRKVFEKLIQDKMIDKGGKDSHSEDYNCFSYKCLDYWVSLIFIHSRAKLYFLVQDKENKLIGFQRMDLWAESAIVDIFDLNSTHFFPLETTQQVLEIEKFAKSCIDKLMESSGSKLNNTLHTNNAEGKRTA